jgi:hypothetical protein
VGLRRRTVLFPFPRDEERRGHSFGYSVGISVTPQVTSLASPRFFAVPR